MEFFAAQDEARNRTHRLILLFAVAVLAIMLVIYITLRGILLYNGATVDERALRLGVAGGTLFVVLCGSLYRIAQLRSGGAAVARMLGAREVAQNTTDPDERRLINVIEEMSIATGTRVPGIFILDNEDGINAFAAGFAIDDAVVAVTRGAVQHLNRAELQGVVAHEFSHILYGDMRLNIRLMGVLFGIFCIAGIGRSIIPRRSRGKNSGGLVLFGLALIAIGFVGVFFGRLIQAAVSRQREFLADASAVRFTRDTSGIVGALSKIGGWARGSSVADHHAQEAGHFLFATGISPRISPLATHPALDERIWRIDPKWEGSFTSVTAPVRDVKKPAVAPDGASALTSITVPHLIATVGTLQPASLAAATSFVDSIPDIIRRAAHDPDGAQALLYALLRHRVGGDGAPMPRVGGPALTQQTLDLIPIVSALPDAARLPLVDLLLPALRQVEPARRDVILHVAQQLVAADGRTDYFEFAIVHMLKTQLAPAANAARAAGDRIYSMLPLSRDIEIALSALAWSGSDSDDAAAAAFRAGVAALPDSVRNRLNLAARDSIGIDALGQALDRLRTAAPALQKRILEACAHATSHDGIVHIHEMQILRALAEAMNCPMPLLASPVPAPAGVPA